MSISHVLPCGSASHISALINEGHLRQAWKDGYDHLYDPAGDCPDAHFYFQLALVEHLYGCEMAAGELMASARQSENYTLTMEGDFQRDQALYFIRTGRLERAADALRRAELCHEGVDDENRRIVLVSAWARWHAAQGQSEKAAALFREADARWWVMATNGVLSGDPKPNRQWQLNNSYQWLRLGVQMPRVPDLGYRGGFSVAHYLEFMRHEPRRKRRLAAWLMWRFGARGARLVDLNHSA